MELEFESFVSAGLVCAMPGLLIASKDGTELLLGSEDVITLCNRKCEKRIDFT